MNDDEQTNEQVMLEEDNEGQGAKVSDEKVVGKVCESPNVTTMIEALWSIEFIVEDQNTPAGVLMIIDNCVFGGGETYCYSGEYALSRGRINLRLDVLAYGEPGSIESIFGKRPEFELELAGQIENDQIVLSGGVKFDSESTVIAVATRRHELPKKLVVNAVVRQPRETNQTVKEWLQNLLHVSQQSEQANRTRSNQSYSPANQSKFSSAADVDRQESRLIISELKDLKEENETKKEVK